MAFCLLLEPARPDTEIDGKALHHVAHRWKQLHVLLYVSTVVLMAGVIEVVALYSWSLAPFSGVSEVKVHADICKSSAQAGRPDLEPLSRMKFCLKLAEEVEAAKAVDGLRRVVRAHAVTFGAGFSALLVSLYAPSVLLLRSRFRRLLESRSHNGAGIDDAAMLKRYDLEMELPRRLVNALTTLGPLVVGILSGVITF